MGQEILGALSQLRAERLEVPAAAWPQPWERRGGQTPPGLCFLSNEWVPVPEGPALLHAAFALVLAGCVGPASAPGAGR